MAGVAVILAAVIGFLALNRSGKDFRPAKRNEQQIGRALNDLSFDQSVRSLELQAEVVDLQIRNLEEPFTGGKRLGRTDLRRAGNARPIANSEAETNRALSPNDLAEIEELKKRKADLLSERDYLIANRGQINAVDEPGWFEAYNVGILLMLVPFIVIGIVMVRYIFARELPDLNPLGLTDVERKSVLFVGLCVIIAGVGFAIAIWAISLT